MMGDYKVCEICNETVKDEDAVLLYGDVWVNIDYSDATNIYCNKCAKENNLI